MTKAQLRAWINARRITQAKAASILGLSRQSLVRQLTDAATQSPVGRQTEIIADLMDKHEPAI